MSTVQRASSASRPSHVVDAILNQSALLPTICGGPENSTVSYAWRVTCCLVGGGLFGWKSTSGPGPFHGLSGSVVTLGARAPSGWSQAV